MRNKELDTLKYQLLNNAIKWIMILLLPGLILEVSAGNTTMLCSKIVMNPESKSSIEAPDKGKEISKNGYQDTVLEKMKEFRDNRMGRSRG